jgi:hypothetical protein
MREIFKAYSLSFLIHSLLLFGSFLLTQRLVPSEKRLIEIDLSLENLQRQPHADLSQGNISIAYPVDVGIKIQR